MLSMKKKIGFTFCFSALVTISMSLPAAAQSTINIDFDNPAGNSFGSASNPYIGDGVVPGGTNVWNQVSGGANGGPTILNSVGNPAGISVALSRAPLRTDMPDFDSGGGIQTFGRTIDSDDPPNTVFDTNAGLFRDWAFANNNIGGDVVIATRIAGLSPGDYDFYLYAAEYSGGGATRPGNLDITYGTSATASASFNQFSSNTALIENSTANSLGLVDGGNYVKMSATINSTESFFIFGDFDVAGQAASLNGLQIVQLTAGPPACDVNLNGVCNSTDFATIRDSLFQFDGDATRADGDLNGDGMVNFADYRTFKDFPGRVVGFDSPSGLASAAGVPEPGSLALLGICSVLLMNAGSRRRHR